jgi:hypothetical protein
VNGKSWKKTSLLRKIELAKSTGNDSCLTNENDKRDNTFNPVLQNVTSLFEYLNTVHRDYHKVKRSRKKQQSRQRNCAGQCEDSQVSVLGTRNMMKKAPESRDLSSTQYVTVQHVTLVFVAFNKIEDIADFSDYVDDLASR